jgi:hypothetical protein
MKPLAITHRATARDHIDLAAILKSGCACSYLLAISKRKYGSAFNPMVSLRALVTFSDLEAELHDRRRASEELGNSLHASSDTPR